MKHLTIVAVAAFLLAAIVPLSSASYDNNEFQRKSRSYSDMAAKAYDEGDYDSSVANAQEAEKYAELSAAFIERMIARADAESSINRARTRLAWAKANKGEKLFPRSVIAAETAIASADEYFKGEDYPKAKTEAERALAELAVIKDVYPLPAYWKVNTWTSTKDCFWNIASNPAVYGDPWLWERIYQANRKALPRPGDPDLIEPGMVITIPSLEGELREGFYDPSIKYEPFKKAVK